MLHRTRLKILGTALTLLLCSAGFAQSVFDFARKGDWDKVRELAVANPDLLHATEEGTNDSLKDIAERNNVVYEYNLTQSIVEVQAKRARATPTYKSEKSLAQEIAEREHSFRQLVDVE